MIEFKKNTNDKYDLLNDGEKLDCLYINPWTSPYTETPTHFIVEMYGRNSGKKLLSLIEGLSYDKFRSISIKDWLVQDSIKIDLSCIIADEFPVYEFKIAFNRKNWKYSFEFEEYYVEFSRIQGTDVDNVYIGKKTAAEIVIVITFDLIKSARTLLQEVLFAEAIWRSFHNQAIRNFTTQNTIELFFHFPDELKTPCEQYLLYFAKFLQDLGINTSSNLKEDAGKVLFSVTPTDDIEALDKIREALAVYLHLPSSPIVYDESFAAMRQKQQIENLQHSQRMVEMEFRLSQKVIESQDKIIFEKNTLIDQQREIIEKIRSASVMIDSAENKEELEEIFEGLKIGKSKFLAEQLGLHLNPATALKTVGKKILGRADENKSVLGLDEKD